MKRYTLNNPHAEIRQYKARVVVLLVVMGVLIAGLLGRLIYLQVVQHKYYLTLSKQNLLSVAPVDPSRGLIYDRNGILLAANVPVFSLEITPDKVPNLKQTLQNLSQLIQLSPADLQAFDKQRAQNRKFNPIPLKVKLSEDEIATFAVNQYRFPGVSVQAHLVRYYPFGALMEPVLGYVGRINVTELAAVDPANYSVTNYIGKTGIEKYYENQLHGEVGIQQLETSAQGQVIRASQNRPAIAGENLHLTIDSHLQAIAQQALNGQSGAVVALDPRNGEILALVSNPNFDPNQFVTGISNSAYQLLQNDPQRPLFNRVLQGEFPPGSTMKPFYALGGLSNGVISTSDHFYCPGFFKLPNSSHIYHCWWRTGHGSIAVEEAIVQSCDTFFYHLAQNSGIARMDAILQEFGFGQMTGIDTSTERSGLVPSPTWKMRVHHTAWYPGDTIDAGIGQGFLLVTPLQLANAVMRLVDHGSGYQIHLLQATETPSGAHTIVSPNLMTPINLPKSDIDLVLRAMHEVVSDPRGTGYRAGADAPYTFGGKSGTAQVFSLHGNQKDLAKMLPQQLRDHAWFAAFAPADHPTIVMVVFVEHGGEGEASLVTRHILDGYFKKNAKQSA
jgi:penicillin-binding protein 2